MLKKNIRKAGGSTRNFPALVTLLRVTRRVGRTTKIPLGRPLRLGNMTGVRYPPWSEALAEHCSARDIRIYTPYIRTFKVARDTRSRGRELRNTRSSRHAGLTSTRVRRYPRIRKYLSSTHDFGFPISNVAEYSTSDG